MGLKRMTELEILIHFVAVAAAVFRSRDDAGALKVGENTLHGALRNPYLDRKISHGHHRFPVQTDENMGVVG